MAVTTPSSPTLERGQRPPPEPLRPGVLDRLAGEASAFVGNLRPFLPQELIGGVVPHVPGTEDETVWNAAAQSCGTEKVNYVYSVADGRCWFLACPSAALASNPDSWCPLAAALPGNSEYWDRETVYIYEQEGLSAAMRWDPETGRMQVFVGASRTLLPRVQSMDANFVTINPEVAQMVPWRNRSIHTEKLSRATARILLLSGLAVNVLLILILMMMFFSTALVDRNLADVRKATEEASSALMDAAAKALQSQSSKHLVRIQQILDDLQKVDGTLVRYEVESSGKVTWEALILPAYSGGVGSVKGEVKQGIERDGRVRMIGNK